MSTTPTPSADGKDKQRLSNTINKLKLNNFKLDHLHAITKLINNNAKRAEIFEKVENVLRVDLRIGKALLVTKELGKWEICFSFGVKAHYFDVNNLSLITDYDSVLVVNESIDFAPFDYIIPITHKTEALAYLFLADFDEDEVAISAIIKNLPYIQTMINIVVVAVENKILFKQKSNQEKMDKELELASEVHAMLFPKYLPQNTYIKCDHYYLPHHHIGGDYYDMIQINDNEYIMCIADVSGKGISAALLMSTLQANLHAITNYNNSLAEIVQELNKKINKVAQGDRFITMFLAKYNSVTKLFTYINAGHLPVYVTNKYGINKLTVGCAGIGMLEVMPNVLQGAFIIDTPTNLLLYTDGVTETENPEGVQFDTERVEEVLNAKFYESPARQTKALLTALDDFRKRKPFVDDITLMSCTIE
jgi:phosphoserine phosphatase RsbU/P